MSFSPDWWTTDLVDEPCDSCGVKPSKSMGHGATTCQKCYDASWCPKCHYALEPGHVCPDAEERARRHVDTGITMLMIADSDELEAALKLAEELTREEQSEGAFSTWCKWCKSQQGTADGEHFVHLESCIWKRFRAYFDEEEETT